MTPPLDLADHVSRVQAAELLGYQSIFRVRQLEKEGRLTSIRGAMGSAWYPRRQVLALAAQDPPAARAQAGTETDRPAFPARRRTDPELIAYLRGTAAESAARSPTVADLVADMGVSIARAQKVYRFWLAHDRHPAAATARATPAPQTVPPRPAAAVLAPGSGSPERRSLARRERAALIRQLRAPDPALRAAAFAALKKAAASADVT